MESCLFHPQYGYYLQKGPIIGNEGDFTTAPEISQLFGESIALFIANYISPLPEKFRIVELGPGRGTLAKDLMKVINTIPNIQNRFYEYIFIEKSEQMQLLQNKALNNTKCSFYPKISSCPSNLSGTINIVVANEFFDVLPINLIKVRQRHLKM